MRAPRLLAFASLVLTACGAATPPPAHFPAHVAPAPPDGFRDPARRTKIAAATTKLDAFFADVAKKQQIPGLVVGLVADGDLVWSKGYGVKDTTTSAPVDADTVFRIGSITKTFTAIAALQLRDAGRVSLDAPASKWMPALDDVAYPSSDSAPITLRGMLTHTSGLPRLGAFTYTDPKRAPTEADIAASLRGLPLAYVPGTREEYSNLAFGLAGIVIGHAASMPYRDYVTAYLLRPLGMASTAWDREAYPADRLATAYAKGPSGAIERQEHWRLGASEGGGGLYSTMRDMARWAAMHLQAYPPRDDADAWPVKRATLREAMTAHVVDPFDGSSADGVGFGWNTTDDCDLAIVEKNGGTEGFHSALYMAPDRGIAILALANLADANLDRPALGALRMLAKDGVIPPRVAMPTPAMVDARDRLLALYDRWDDAEAARLFSPEMLGELGGLAHLRDIRDADFKVTGACSRADGDPVVENATHAAWRYVCEHGALDVDAILSGAIPPLRAARATPIPAPSDALAQVGARIAALSSRWDDATHEELLFPTFERDEMKQFFASIAKDYGACAIERPTGGDGASEAKWRLACKRGALDLDVTIDPRNGRVGRMLVVPAKGGARCAR